MMRNGKIATHMPTSLRGIADRARRDRKARFGDLYRLLNEENLKLCFRHLRREAAAGVDGVTYTKYEKNLDENIRDLVERLRRKRYRARLVRRKHIPKGEGKTRPLGIPVLEDRLVQMAVAKILNAIYEPRFLNVSWGYRPGRGSREASRVLAGRLAIGKYHWVVDADLKSYFDTINHDWLLRMVAEHVHDRALLNLIRKWLKAGVLEEDGRVLDPTTGTPQGGVVSPVLANIYLHYVLDLWFERVVRPGTKGQAMLMRYADDFVVAFEDGEEAKAFLANLPARLEKFGLRLSEEKTKLILFSRCDIGGNGGFDFLGFRYHWTASRKGVPKVQRMTAPKKLKASVARFQEWIKKNRHEGVKDLMPKLKRKLEGYWIAYGVTGNFNSLNKFWRIVCRLLYKWLNRRSQRKSYTWKGLYAMLDHFGIKGPRIVDDRQLRLKLW
jgi:group II intron reverse transcriptase/maturase